jgi:hypothetical protein
MSVNVTTPLKLKKKISLSQGQFNVTLVPSQTQSSKATIIVRKKKNPDTSDQPIEPTHPMGCPVNPPMGCPVNPPQSQFKIVRKNANTSQQIKSKPPIKAKIVEKKHKQLIVEDNSEAESGTEMSEDEEEEIGVGHYEQVNRNKFKLETKTIDEPDGLPEIAEMAMITECLSSLRKRDPNSKLSKDDLIEECDAKRDQLINSKSKYTKAIFEQKLKDIDRALSKLRIGFIKENTKEWNHFTETVWGMIEKKKIPEDQFKKKLYWRK